MPRHQTKRISFVSVDGPDLGSRLGIKIGTRLKIILLGPGLLEVSRHQTKRISFNQSS
jgi:hypothetical protein